MLASQVLFDIAAFPYNCELVAALEHASHGEVDFQAASRWDRHVSALSFYLSTQQCDRANDARERVELAPEK
jgi:hypothetical protein